MAERDIIVVGASAGGVEALTNLVRRLPADLPAAVFVVLHLPANGTSVLPHILSRAGPLPASHATDGDPIRRGHIYVAPPNRHLLVHRGHIRLARGPRENRQRPAVDPLFRTAARAYGPRVIGVILSGTLDDGTAGLLAVKARGGLAVVQDPEDALFAGMPSNAIANVDVDRVLPVADIASALVEFAGQPVAGGEERPASHEMEMEADMAELEPDATHSPDRPGIPSAFSCPDCGGVLWELHDGELLRFRCRVGHAYSPEALDAGQAEVLEAALWVALRGLEEKAALAERLLERSRAQGHGLATARFAEQAEEARQHAEVVRTILLNGKSADPPEAVASD